MTKDHKHIQHPKKQKSKVGQKLTEYWSTKPVINSLGIAKAPRRSSKVSVIPIPSIVTVIPIIVHSGLTQLYEPGFNSPTKQPNATHTGKAVETASPTASIQPRKPLPPPSSLKVFDEMPQRSGGSGCDLRGLGDGIMG